MVFFFYILYVLFLWEINVIINNIYGKTRFLLRHFHSLSPPNFGGIEWQNSIPCFEMPLKILYFFISWTGNQTHNQHVKSRTLVPLCHDSLITILLYSNNTLNTILIKTYITCDKCRSIAFFFAWHFPYKYSKRFSRLRTDEHVSQFIIDAFCSDRMRCSIFFIWKKKMRGWYINLSWFIICN